MATNPFTVKLQQAATGIIATTGVATPTVSTARPSLFARPVSMIRQASTPQAGVTEVDLTPPGAIERGGYAPQAETSTIFAILAGFAAVGIGLWWWKKQKRGA